MIRTYSLKRDGNKDLSTNFKVKEFRCKDGTDIIKICDQTVVILQSIRDYFGKPVTINSAYRTPSHNKKVGGATHSQHVVGTAADIKIAGIPPEAVAAYLEANYPNHGIGLYSTFVHVDSRGKKSYWLGSTGKAVSSFKKGNIYKNYKKQVISQPVVQPKEDDIMTGKEIYEALQEYTKTLSIPSWAVDEFNEAIELGITDGTYAMDLIPRYQAAIMAKRAVKKAVK